MYFANRFSPKLQTKFPTFAKYNRDRNRNNRPEDIWKNFDEDKKLSPRFGIGLFEILKEVFKVNILLK